jgi:hypothetical protein
MELECHNFRWVIFTCAYTIDSYTITHSRRCMASSHYSSFTPTKRGAWMLLSKVHVAVVLEIFMYLGGFFVLLLSVYFLYWFDYGLAFFLN